MSLVAAWRLAAREHVRRGALAQAIELYRRVLDQGPDPEAAEFLGLQAWQQGDLVLAAGYLGSASSLAPDQLDLRRNYGVVLFACGRMREAAEALAAVVAQRPQALPARLYLGLAQWHAGDQRAGVWNCTLAIEAAQQHGRWRDVATTPPELLPLVQEAVSRAREYRERRLGERMQAAVGDLGRQERLARFIRVCAGWREEFADPRQRPKTHYFPGLPAMPWFEKTVFPWARALEDRYDVFLQEYQAVSGQLGGFEPFLRLDGPEQTAKYLATTGAAPNWDAFFFYRHGVRNDENCRRCPRTAEILDSLPLVRLPGLAPEICFSVLTPGTRILPHRGDSNLRSVVHLPLVVPPGCALKVAGEARPWAEGEVLAFDDTYEHEAWNESDQPRAILLLDAWNPFLSEAEQNGIRAVIEELGILHEEKLQLSS